ILSAFLFLLPHIFFLLFFFFNDPPTTEIYTLSLHDALPIWVTPSGYPSLAPVLPALRRARLHTSSASPNHVWFRLRVACGQPKRSEEHTSELQSQSNLVCRLLLEKKKKKKNTQTT